MLASAFSNRGTDNLAEACSHDRRECHDGRTTAKDTCVLWSFLVRVVLEAPSMRAYEGHGTMRICPKKESRPSFWVVLGQIPQGRERIIRVGLQGVPSLAAGQRATR